MAVVNQYPVVRNRVVPFVVVKPGFVVVVTGAVVDTAGTLRSVNVSKGERQIRRTRNRASRYSRITLYIRKTGFPILDAAFVVIVATRIFWGVVEPRLLIFNLVFVVRIDSGEWNRTSSSF